MEPQQAVDEYIQARKYGDTADATIQNYTYRLKRFVEFCGRAGIDDMEQVSGRTVEKYKKDRAENGDVNPVTLEQQLRTFHHFMKWCEASELVESGIADRMLIPDATPEQRVRNKALDADRAEEILEYLQKYKYASREHIVFHLLWHTGMRVGTMRALDVEDWVPERDYIGIRHRPDEGTSLKLKYDGERNVTIANDSLKEALSDWVDKNRPKVADDHDRRPLIATKYGRAARNTIRTDVYKVVQPCRYSGKCPHGEDIESCVFRDYGNRANCPSSTFPHAIRSGAVTEHLNQDTPKEIVAERANMSEEILEKHYDERTKEERRERRRREMDIDM